MKFLNTTKKRDVARWCVAVIAFSLLCFDFHGINQNYEELYEFERSENNILLVEPVIIEPSVKLTLQRDINFKFLNINFYMLFLVTLWLGRMKVEGIIKR
jgi:hypothetical protein